MTRRRARQTDGARDRQKDRQLAPPLPISRSQLGPRQRKQHTGVPADHFVKPEKRMSRARALKLVRAELKRRGLR